MIEFCNISMSHILISFLSLYLFSCNATSWTARTWSPGVVITVSEQSSTLQPLKFEGRGSQILLSGKCNSGFFCDVPIYYSELLGGKTLWSEQAILRPSDQPYSKSNIFGSSFDIDGDTIIVGSPSDSTHSPNAGSAYVFQGSWTKWSEQQILHVDNPTDSGRRFGYQVGIHENFALISAYFDDDKGSQAGSVYVFKAESYTSSVSRALFEPDEIQPPIHPVTTTPQKPAPVAKLPVKLPVKIPSTKKPTFYPTEAPVQTIPYRSSWTQLQKLYAKDTLTNDNFGFKVVVNDGTAVIGAPGQFSNTGAVYVFSLNKEVSTWSQQQKLALPVSAADFYIGYYFDIYENTIIVGSSLDDPTYGGLNKGAVYVYKYSSKSKYTLQQTLRPADSQQFGYFGSSVALYDNVIFAGAAGNPGGLFDGNTYIFTYNGKSWSQQQEMSDPKGLTQYSFTNPYVYGMSAFVTDSGPNAYYFTADFNWSCVIVSLGDQFGDGWDTAKLVISAPDGTSDSYAPYCDSRNPFQFRYCPTLPTDSGVYSFSIPNADKSKYFWEIYWTVKEESTGEVHYGDYNTKLSFDFNTAKLGFDLYSSQHEVHNRTVCPICPGKPQPKPQPKATPLPPKIPVDRTFPVVTSITPVKSTATTPAKSVPAAASATVAAPKVFKSRQLLQSSAPTGLPTTVPSSHPSGVPSGEPSGVPTGVPVSSTPSRLPTHTPTAWPSLNGSASRDWHWLTMYDMGADGWFENDNSGGAYYISDVNGQKLISTGTLCPNHISYKCWQTLLDGKYILRVGGGLDADSGDHEWQFCGRTGSAQYQLLFEIQGGKCFPLQSFSKNQFCSEKLDPLVRFVGTILLQGMASDAELLNGDSIVFDHLIKSLSTTLEQSTVNILNMYYVESLGGHVVQFSADVSRDKSGYDGRDYAQVQELQEMLNDEFSTSFTDGKFVSNLVGYSQISTSDSDIFGDVTQATLLSFAVSDIKFNVRVVENDPLSLGDGGIQVTSTHHSTSHTTYSSVAAFFTSTNGYMTIAFVGCGLILLLSLAAFSIIRRKKSVTFSTLPTTSPFDAPTVMTEHFISRRMKLIDNEEEEEDLDDNDYNEDYSGRDNDENHLNNSMLEDRVGSEVVKESFESNTYNYFERNDVEDYTKKTSVTTRATMSPTMAATTTAITPKKKISFASTTKKISPAAAVPQSQPVEYGYGITPSAPLPPRYSTSPKATSNSRESSPTATANSSNTSPNYNSSVFLVGVPVKSPNGASGQMAFNTSPMLTERESPIDLWAGMKDLAKDEDALLNSMHNLY